MSKAIDIGDGVALTYTFRDEAGAPADPTTITLVVMSPGRSNTTYTYADGDLTKEGVGVYSKVVNPTIAGRWRYRWTGAGGGIDWTDQGAFWVRHRQTG